MTKCPRNFAALYDGSEISNVDFPVAALSSGGVKVELQAMGAGIPAGSPLELSAVQLCNTVRSSAIRSRFLIRS